MMMFNKRPTVSVVIPCHNAAPYIAQTIQSVMQQSTPAREIIVVDDGSVDGSRDIVASLCGSIRLIAKQNEGAASARNLGMERATGDWIAFLDADDVWRPTKLERQMNSVRFRPDVVCVHAGYYLFNERGVISEHIADVQSNWRLEDYFIKPIVNTSTAIVRADISPRFPEWAGRGGDGEDMIFFAELSRHGEFDYVGKSLAGYRMHRKQTTKSVGNSVRHLMNRLRWLKDNESNLGRDQLLRLYRLLTLQALDWLNLARWNRQWDRYWALREFAETLDWPDGRPAVLDERPYPKFCYSAKDAWDRFWSRNRNQSSGSGINA